MFMACSWTASAQTTASHARRSMKAESAATKLCCTMWWAFAARAQAIARGVDRARACDATEDVCDFARTRTATLLCKRRLAHPRVLDNATVSHGGSNPM